MELSSEASDNSDCLAGDQSKRQKVAFSKDVKVSGETPMSPARGDSEQKKKRRIRQARNKPVEIMCGAPTILNERPTIVTIKEEKVKAPPKEAVSSKKIAVQKSKSLAQTVNAQLQSLTAKPEIMELKRPKFGMNKLEPETPLSPMSGVSKLLTPKTPKSGNQISFGLKRQNTTLTENDWKKHKQQQKPAEQRRNITTLTDTMKEAVKQRFNK